MDLKSAMLTALDALPACTALAFAREEIPLPLIVIGDDVVRVHARADGQDYLEEWIESVDVYAQDQQTLESLCQAAHHSLSQLGLRRVACQDLYDEQAYAWRKHMRYRALLQGDMIYQ